MIKYFLSMNYFNLYDVNVHVASFTATKSTREEGGCSGRGHLRDNTIFKKAFLFGFSRAYQKKSQRLVEDIFI